MTEVEKLVERLKHAKTRYLTLTDYEVLEALVAEAASTLESLDRRVAELEGALRPFAEQAHLFPNARTLYQAHFNRARSALPDPPGPCEGRGSSRDHAPTDDGGDAYGANESEGRL